VSDPHVVREEPQGDLVDLLAAASERLERRDRAVWSQYKCGVSRLFSTMYL
jgi:hypothetical protein